MKIEQLAAALGAHTHASSASLNLDIQSVYAGDRMSDLLSAASEHTLLVTHITNQSLLNLIELMDVPAVCLVNGATPERAVLDAANASHTPVLVAPWSLYETCGRLYRILEAAPSETASA